MKGVPFVNEGFVVLNFTFPLFLEIVMYANEFETMEKPKLPEIKKLACKRVRVEPLGCTSPQKTLLGTPTPGKELSHFISVNFSCY